MVIVTSDQAGVGDQPGHGQGHDVGSQVGDAPFPNSGVLDTHPESQDADDHEAVIAVVLGVDDQGCRHGAGGPLDGEGDSMATPWSGQPDQAPSNQRSEGG
jgi:hypothetical protein